MTLNKWHVLSLLDESFLQDVKAVVVFGSSGNEALLLTEDNEIYGIGANCNCCLGLGTPNSFGFVPKIIDRLTGQTITQIVFGCGPHLLALTSNGAIYSWGGNGYGQLGHGKTAVHNHTPKPVNMMPLGIAISAVSCGGYHSLALTKDGEVYAWGFNSCGELGTGDVISRYSPTKVTGLPDDIAGVQITCNHSSSFVVTSTGKVYSWGQNSSGQLGIGSTQQQLQPFIVVFPHCQFIKKLVGGYSHVMALTDNGHIYSWGGNNHGQLGNGSRVIYTSPFHINQDIGRASEVAAVHLSHISAAIMNDKVYVWGECYHQNILHPLETSFSSTDEVFACLSAPACTWRMFHNVESQTKTTLSRCIENRFNDQDTSDIVFIIEGNAIYAHRAILQMRSKYFYSMLQDGKWKESQMNTFEVTEHSYIHFKAFLNYFYTDKVSISTSEIPGLLAIADCYCEDELKRLCEDELIKLIDIENVLMLYHLAIRYNSKVSNNDNL
jgi:RCC1 and BTB domain-containing protein